MAKPKAQKPEAQRRRGIIRLLLEHPEGLTTGGICTRLGVAYNYVERQLKQLLRHRVVGMRRGVPTGGRPGTLWWLRAELHALRWLWGKHEELRSEILASPWYREKMLPVLLCSALAQVYGGSCIPVSNHRAAARMLECVLTESPSFIDLVLSCRLAEVIERELGILVEEEDEDTHKAIASAWESYNSVVTSSLTEALRIVATTCSRFDGGRSWREIQRDREKELEWFYKFQGYSQALRNLWESGAAPELLSTLYDVSLASAALLLRRRAGFNVFKWLRYIPAERREKVMERLREAHMQRV